MKNTFSAFLLPARRQGVPRLIHWLCVLAMLSMGLATVAHAATITVRDAVTGAPVADAIVTFAGAEARSDAGGAVRLEGQGDQVMARAIGYRAVQTSATDLAKAGGVVKLTPFTPKALYLTVYGIGSKSLREGALSLIRTGAANALVIDLKGDKGLVPYPSAAAATAGPAARKLTTIPDLPALAAELHRQGVYLIARIVTFKDDPLAANHPEWAVHRGDGGLFRDREGLAWVDPFRAEVRDYDISLAVEAARAGFDEIQFDYMRFPDSSARLVLARPSTAAARSQAIVDLLTEARRRLTPYNVFLAADVFGYVCWNRDDTGIGQQLEAIMPHLDYLSPMLYPSGFQYGIPGVRNPVANAYAIVRQSLAEAQSRVKVAPMRFRPWLQAFRDYAFDHRLFDAVEVANQIRAAKDFGSDGWMLWNARNTYENTGLALDDGSPVLQACA
jgi:hypothetical protein